MNGGTIARVAVVAAAVLAASSATAQGPPSFQGLGAQSKAYGISGDGLTVVGIAPSGQAGYWRSGTGWQGLGFAGYAYDASNDGSVIVGWTGGSSQTISGNSAFRWTAGGGTVILPAPSNQAYKVSADGTTVVGAHGSSVSNRMPFRYTQATGTVDMTSLDSMPEWAYCKAVNADGSVIGGEGPWDGFIWTAGSTSVLSFFMAVEALSADGTIAVGFRGAAGGSAVCIWTAATGVQELPQFGNGSHYGYDVTADGGIITGYHYADGPQKALVWDQVGGMRNLQDVLEDVYALNLTGWSLRTAMVSADGKVFTGLATNPAGQLESYIAVVPEPATVSLLSLGGLAVLIRRRRSVDRGALKDISGLVPTSARGRGGEGKAPLSWRALLRGQGEPRSLVPSLRPHGRLSEL